MGAGGGGESGCVRARKSVLGRGGGRLVSVIPELFPKCKQSLQYRRLNIHLINSGVLVADLFQIET